MNLHTFLRILFLGFTHLIIAQGDNQEERDLFEKDFSKYIDKTLNKPQITSFINYSNKGSVDNLTGKFGLNIPFHIIKTPYIDIPITLKYSTSGIDLNVVSNEIGMDWNLIAGGSVFRIINDEADEIVSETEDFRYDYEYLDVKPNEYYKKVEEGDAYLINYPASSITRKSGSAAFAPPSHTRGIISTDYINFFPKRHYKFDHSLSEIGSLFEMRLYETYGKTNGYFRTFDLDTQVDYFRVSVGRLNFSFVFKRKDQVFFNHYEKTSTTGSFDDYYQAIPLDDIGVKIKVHHGDFPYTFSAGMTENRDINASGIFKFEITDKKGIVYIFDKMEFSDYENLNEFPNHFGFYDITDKRIMNWKTYATNIYQWKLSQIILPNSDTISFKYRKNEYKYLREVPRQHDGEYLGNLYNLSPQDTSYGIDYLDFHFEGFSIEEIKYNNQKVKFSYEEEREDHLSGGLNLTKIELMDNNNKLIKKFDLEKEFYAYDLDSHQDYRMFLTKIEDSELKNSYIFEYNRPEVLPSRNELRYQDIFGYYLGRVNNSYPSFPKLYITRNNSLGNSISYEEPNGDDFFIIEGTDRIPKLEYPKFGTINRIEFPTGGSLEIDYENNTYYDERLKSKASLGPGVRVSKLRYLNEDDTSQLIKRYEYQLFNDNTYSSGKLLYKPSFAYISNWSFDNSFDRSIWDNEQAKVFQFPVEKTAFHYRKDFANFYSKEMWESSNLDSDSILKKMVRFSNYPMGYKSDIFGREIVYTNVLEKIENSSPHANNNGYTKYYYKYSDNRPTVYSVTGMTDEPSEFTLGTPDLEYQDVWPFRQFDDGVFLKKKSGFIEKKGKEIYPFPKRNFYDSLKNASFGKLEKIEIYDSSENILHSEEYEYDFIKKQSINSNFLNNIETGYLKLHQYRSDDLEQNLFAFYELQQRTYFRANLMNINGLYFFSNNRIRFNSKVVTKSVKKKDYTLIGDFVEKKFSYNYDLDSGNVSEIITSTSKEQKKKVAFEYPYYEGGYWLTDLYEKNMISEPNLTRTFLDNVLLESMEKIYLEENENGVPLLSEIRSSKSSNTSASPDDIRVKIEKYNNKDLPVQISKGSGMKTVYIYGYSDSSIVAKIENAEYDSISQTLIEQIKNKSDLDNDRTIGYNGKEGELRESLSMLRETLPNSLITTYTHDPLIGITSVTDINGNTVYYSYDEKNHLKDIKDTDGNLIKSFEYNYKD